MEPTLIVLLYSSLAAGAAALGAVPLRIRERLPVAWIGWANAVAAGFMLGAAYVLMAAGLERGSLVASAGAALGAAFVLATHRAAGTETLDLNRLDESSPVYAYQILLVNWLHSASEGVAIGAAMAVSIPLGIVMAVAIALHNIPEATVLCTVLRGRGLRLPNAAGLAVVTDTSQILLAIVAFALLAAAPRLLSWALGFAVGALIYLVMAELLPQAYRQAGRTTIALVTILAMGIVVVAGGLGR